MLGLDCCMGFSLVAASRGCCLGTVRGLLAPAPPVVERGLQGVWTQYVSAPGLQNTVSVAVAYGGLVAPRHVGSSCIRNRTCVSCTGWGILYHWATREAPSLVYVRWITSKDLLHSTWSSAQCYVAAWMGEEFGGEWICVHAWLRPFAVHLKLSQRCLLIGYAAKSLQSCLTLCDPRDGSPPGSSVPGILQARTLEWVAISFSSAWKWKVQVKSLSRVRLFTTPWTAAYQAPPSMGFSRQEYWSGVPLPSPNRLYPSTKLKS